MAPRQREDEELPPVYGDEDRDLFTLAVNYGGFFLGDGSDRAYIGGSMMWFDYCDRGYWGLSSIQNIMWDLGFDYAGRARAYWCLPGFEMMHNGLTEIRSSKDTDNMSCAVTLGNKVLCMYVDIDNIIEQSLGGGQVVDDVVMQPRAELPHVISPLKPDLEQACNVAGRERIKRRLSVDGGFDCESSEDEDYEPEIVDSDHHISEDDADLYDENLDQKDVKGKKEADCVEDSEEDDLHLPDSEDDEEIRLKFKHFGPEDMLNPTFKVGQVFASVELLRKAISEYTCQSRRAITLPVNDQQRLEARCVEGCPWYMWASYDNRSKCFMIKKLNDVHTCERNWKIKAFSYKFIAQKYIDTVRADEKISLKNLGRLVQKDWNITVSKPKLGRARKYAQRLIYGDEDAQYSKLWDFASELRRANPGSTFYIACMRQENMNPVGRVHPCYSVDTYWKVYAHILLPLRDESEWSRVVNCPTIGPPKYDKKVGRKKKNRRKQPEEKPTNAGVKMSKHGTIIHCSHCGKSGHNRGGCGAFKAGIPPKKQARKRGKSLLVHSDDEAEPVITQEQEYQLHNQEERATYANMDETMLNVMQQNLPPPREIRHPVPVPESGFIANAREATTSGPSVQNVAMQAQAMKQEKLKEFQAKKEAAELKKLQDAENKALEKQALAAEKALKRKEAAEQRKIEAQLKRELDAEQRRKVQEEKKATQAAAKAEQAAAKAAKRVELEKKRAEQAAAKAAQEEARAAAAQANANSGAGSSAAKFVLYPGKKVSMFDEFR